ncbi:hypothetical protein NMD51_20585 [Escherichia coli]|uniref:hypothetical protein n=1 Tax=Escherichia coli TaxID=562 RepID=UPI002FBE1B1D
MGRPKKLKRFLQIHGATPGSYFWHQFWADQDTEDPSSLGSYVGNIFSDLEPLEQVYIWKLKDAFDIWLDILHSSPMPAEPTEFQKEFRSETVWHFMNINKKKVYDFLFRYIFEGKIEKENISDLLDKLLFDEGTPYPDFFEVSCYFYIIATRIFADEDFDVKENQFFRAMFEAINALNIFICKHEIHLQEENKERHKEASRKGGKNKWIKIRAEVVRLLTEEIRSDQSPGRFNDGIKLTIFLTKKIEKYIEKNKLNSPEDLFDTITNWSSESKSDISALYNLLIK